jgi:hypothetical protein
MTATTEKPFQFLPPSVRRTFALQDALDLRDPVFAPLSDIKTVQRDLKKFALDATTVRDLIESHFLLGFNIAVSTETKPEWRVLTKSIEFFRATGGQKYHELEWPQIFRLVVPHQKPIVTGLEVRRALLCDRGHVENLILAGHLVALKKSQPGPGGSWTICRESYGKFLKGRML